MCGGIAERRARGEKAILLSREIQVFRAGFGVDISELALFWIT
jgi:hypothetical protein